MEMLFIIIHILPHLDYGDVIYHNSRTDLTLLSSGYFRGAKTRAEAAAATANKSGVSNKGLNSAQNFKIMLFPTNREKNKYSL